MKIVGRRQLNFLGHILGVKDLESDCLLGRIDRTRATGRQRTKYINSILGFLGGSQTTESKPRLARKRRNWRFMIDNITR